MFACEENKLNHQNSCFHLRTYSDLGSCVSAGEGNKWASGIDFHLVLQKHFSLTIINCLLSAKSLMVQILDFIMNWPFSLPYH